MNRPKALRTWLVLHCCSRLRRPRRSRVASAGETTEPILLAQSAPAASVPVAREQQDTPYPNIQDNTLSGKGDLEEDEATVRRPARFPSLLGPWFEWKRQFQQDTGLGIGGSYGIMWQNYSSSLISEHNAVGHKFTLIFDYPLLNRGSPNALWFDVVVEDRRPLGTELVPTLAGIGAGSIVPTAASWVDFSLGFTQFYLRQNLFNNRFQYAIGKLFAPNFINAYPFFDDNRQFFNQTFSVSPTIAAPLRGFGMVGAVFPFENSGFYVQSGIYTANSKDTGFTIDTFFDEREYFYHLDIGWSGLARSAVPINARGPMDTDNFHIILWNKDKQENGPGQADGIAFNANKLIGGNVMVFLRGGWSEGWFTDRHLTTGFGWRPANAPSDLFGVGVGWSRPTNRLLREQYTAEVFYRFHVTPNFAVTPDLQYIKDPALNPTENDLWVAGLRLRLSF